MLESSRFADEVSALVFCSMMSQYDIVLLGCLLPGSAAIGDWSLGLGGEGLLEFVLGSATLCWVADRGGRRGCRALPTRRLRCRFVNNVFVIRFTEATCIYHVYK